MENMINNIILGDCLEVMKYIKNASVDMILCDLPYGTTKNKWDSTIPLDKLWEQYERIIKDDGVIALFGQTPFDKVLGTSNLKLLKYEWIWVKSKPTGHLNAKYAPMKKHENILIFSKAPTSYTKKGNRTKYNPQGVYDIEPKVVRRTNNGNYDVEAGNESIQKQSGYPSDVLFFDGVMKTIHPTQKPVELIEYLIKSYTNEGEVVLDNCIGSGTTAIACINTNRNFIGIEKEKEYYDIAIERINCAVKRSEEENPYKVVE